jgi:hypothetical protein
MKGSNEEARLVNLYFSQVKVELFKLYNQMQLNDECITADAIKLRFTGGKEARKVLLEVIDYRRRLQAAHFGQELFHQVKRDMAVGSSKARVGL